MPNELAIQDSKELSVWDGEKALQEIKDLFAPNLTELEFKGFVNMGKALQLNPFLREIWAVKYDKSKPAQIFIGRDGYRVNARRHPQFDYLRVEAVYSNDEYLNDNGVITHKFGFANRGTLLGAYCVVKRKDSSEPEYRSVLLSEYDKRQGNWNTMKETMIKKVAESQGLRASFPDKFAGTYSEYEEGFIIEQKGKSSHSDQMSDILAKKGLTHASNTNAPINHIHNPDISNSIAVVQNSSILAQSASEIKNIDDVLDTDRTHEDRLPNQDEGVTKATESQLAIIDEAIHATGFKPDRVSKAFKHYGVKSFADMTEQQADEMIEILNRTE
jgi:phage recombination protein Bet